MNCLLFIQHKTSKLSIPNVPTKALAQDELDPTKEKKWTLEHKDIKTKIN